MTIHIFVSSTWLDLQSERRAVEVVLQRLRQTKFVGMEYFGSRDETTERASLDEVDRAQVYAGMLGGRYGSGITEAEYRRARQLKLPCFLYFKDEKTIAPEWKEQDATKAARLEALKQELRAAHTVQTFGSPDDLAAKVTADLHGWLFDHYLPPRLERVANGEWTGPEAQALVRAIKDWEALPADLVGRLRGVRQVIASGPGSVAIGGGAKGSTIITGNVHQQGDGNVIGSHNQMSFTKTITTQGVTLNDLLALLAQMREQIRTAALPADDRQAVEANLNLVEKEVNKEKPRLPIIESSLKSIESMVKSTESIGAVAAKLVPLLSQAAEFARQLFP